MKVLVTGGAGFIGSHLCETLLMEGHFVYCFDNLCTGFKENVEHLQKNKNFQFVYGDVNDPFNFLVDEIYHLASPASPIQYQKNPVFTLKTNVIGSINALELAQKSRSKVFLASTSEVYGDPTEHPQKESYRGNVDTTGPRSCYDESKRCAETLFFDYHRNYNVDIRISRIFNTYGPKLNGGDGRVISNFICQALKNEPITVYGDGTQTRSFQYISDTVRGILATMRNDKQYVGPINIGNPDEINILELAKQIIKLTKSSSTIVFKTLPIDDPKIRKPDISLAEKYLDWKPFISLQDGLQQTVKYFKETLKKEKNYDR
jgi:UDP-glucuronate decarboxylase